MPPLRGRLSKLAEEMPPTFWFLWWGTVVNRLGGFVIPFLSLYLTSQRGVPVSQAGLIVALFGAGSFASQLTGGELADRLGRRPVLLLSLLGAPPLMAALGFAQNLVLIGALTLAVGFFTDLYRPAVSAAIADIVPAEDRTKAFGYMYWAINLGAALAPIVAGFLANFNYALLFIGDALTTLVYGLVVLARIKETQPGEAVSAARVSFRRRARQLASEPILLAFTAMTLVFGVIYMQGITTLPLDMVRHGLGPTDYGLAAATNGIVIVLITIQLSSVFTKWEPFRAMALAAILLGAGFGVNAWAATLPVYAFGVLVWTLGEIVGAAVAPTVISELAPVELRGLYQGVFGSAFGLSFFVGPLIGSWVFGTFSPNTLWLGCVVVGALLALAYLGLVRPAQIRLARGRAPTEPRVMN